VLAINSYIKFGITSNWESRSRAYDKELYPDTFQLVKTIDFDNRWQAELIEQIVKWRLRRWVAEGRHEWIELKIQHVLDCIHQVIDEIKPEFHKHEYIHRKGNDRWDFYKQIAQYYYDV
jgi:hypothetical protein